MDFQVAFGFLAKCAEGMDYTDIDAAHCDSEVSWTSRPMYRRFGKVLDVTVWY